MNYTEKIGTQIYFADLQINFFNKQSIFQNLYFLILEILWYVLVGGKNLGDEFQFLNLCLIFLFFCCFGKKWNLKVGFNLM